MPPPPPELQPQHEEHQPAFQKALERAIRAEWSVENQGDIDPLLERTRIETILRDSLLLIFQSFGTVLVELTRLVTNNVGQSHARTPHTSVTNPPKNNQIMQENTPQTSEDSYIPPPFIPAHYTPATLPQKTPPPPASAQPNTNPKHISKYQPLYPSASTPTPTDPPPFYPFQQQNTQPGRPTQASPFAPPPFQTTDTAATSRKSTTAWAGSPELYQSLYPKKKETQDNNPN